MENLHINHLAVFVCALMSLAIGALWYSPLLFAKVWQKETGLSDEQLASANPLKSYSIAFLLSWLMAYNLAAFLGDKGTTWQFGTIAGLLAGLGWASFSLVIISLFEQRSFKHMLINCGYLTVYFTLMGFVLGIWR